MSLAYTLPVLRDELKSLYNISQRMGSVLHPLAQFTPSFVNRNDFNSVFTTKKYWLRYDFTKELLSSSENLSHAISSTGPVFRDGPVSNTRKKQFNQFDIDVPFDQGFFYLKKTLAYFRLKNIKFTTHVNDLSLLRQHELLYDQGLIDAGKMILERQTQELLCDEFKKKYAKLDLGPELIVDPNMVRGHNYYNCFVFEIKINKISFCAGGSYVLNDKLFFGISVGLERLATIVTPTKKPVLVIYYESLPEQLLTKLDLLKKPFLLIAKKHNIRKDWAKINATLDKLHLFASGTLVITKKDILEDNYYYRDKNNKEINGNLLLFVEKLVTVL